MTKFTESLDIFPVCVHNELGCVWKNFFIYIYRRDFYMTWGEKYVFKGGFKEADYTSVN